MVQLSSSLLVIARDGAAQASQVSIEKPPKQTKENATLQRDLVQQREAASQQVGSILEVKGWSARALANRIQVPNQASLKSLSVLILCFLMWQGMHQRHVHASLPCVYAGRKHMEACRSSTLAPGEKTHGHTAQFYNPSHTDSRGLKAMSKTRNLEG